MPTDQSPNASAVPPAADLASITAPEPIRSVAELIDLRESLGGEGGEGIRRPLPQWAFRGQPRDFGGLTPSFQRQFERHSYGAAELIEERLIEAFREHYARLPDPGVDMPRPEQIGTGHDLRCLCLMQHYEIPTRLLDWTADFWIAVYFACASLPDSAAELWFYNRALFEAQRVENPSLMAFLDRSADPQPEPSLLHVRHRTHVSYPIVEVDPQLSARMRQQHAHHTVSESVFSDHAVELLALQDRLFPPAPDAPAGAQARWVHRVLIDASCKGKALQFLAQTLDITASTIFPDVVGLGRFLRWQFDSLRTMML
jgi:hypothetical protein